MGERTATRFVHKVSYLPWAAAGVVLMVLTAIPVHPNKAPAPERAVFRVLNEMPEFIYWPLWVLMQVGNLLAIPAAALAAAAFRRFRLAVAILIAGGAKLVVARIVKDIVVRERPAAVIDDVIRRGDASAAGQAYVSGHAIIAFAIAVLLHPYLDRRWRIVVWGLAVAVCVGRVYVGAHLPLDVVGGAGLGVAIGCLLNLALGTPERSDPEVAETAPAVAGPAPSAS